MRKLTNNSFSNLDAKCENREIIMVTDSPEEKTQFLVTDSPKNVNSGHGFSKKCNFWSRILQKVKIIEMCACDMRKHVNNYTLNWPAKCENPEIIIPVTETEKCEMRKV